MSRGTVWGVAVAAGLVAGCGTAPDVPMATDGPNQVVVKVPGMTWASCPAKVSEALATLPWVEPTSIVADRRTRQARFAVTDRAKFDLAQVERVVFKAGYPGTKLLTGPTEQ